jgi:uncharacterized membrane protein
MRRRRNRSADPSEAARDPELDELPSPARLELFSDAVFAIIITLLVLDLKVPRAEEIEGGLAAALLRQWPVYVAYVLSFLQVGVVWSNHHTMFRHIRRTDHAILVYNLLLLMFVAVLPFTTALFSEWFRIGASERRLAALLYSGALGIAGLFFSAIWWHALRAGLVDPLSDPDRLHALRRHWQLLPVLYGLAFGLAFLSVWISVILYAGLLLYYALPGPAVVRWMTAGRARRRRDAKATIQ